MRAPESCQVCQAADPLPYQKVAELNYWRCQVCEARFLDPQQHPTPEEEYRHYLHHENDPDDPGYRRFLAKLAEPLLARIPLSARGLDYGCGPGPALAAMLGEKGHEVALYDPFFHRDPAVFGKIYDFVTCTEVVEHFHRPAHEFARLRSLVKPGGLLAIMTCFQTDDLRFATWHYRKDPTHVVFYREETFRRLAKSWGWHCDIPAKDIVFLYRPFTPPE